MIKDRRGSWFAALLVLAMVLSACATSPAPSPSAPSPSAPSQPAQPAAPAAPKLEQTKVKIALASTVLTSGYPFLTTPIALNYWKNEGFEDVEIILTQGSQQVLQLLTTNQADLGVVNPEPIIIGRQTQNLPIKSVFTISAIASWSIGVPEGSPIKSVKDLKGKNIGVFSMASGGIPYLKARLKDEGLDPDKDVNLIAVGFGAQAGEALKNGQVAGVVLWSTAFAGLKNAGYKLTYLPQAPWETKLYAFNIAATEQVIKDKPEMIRRILRGMAKSNEFGYARPEAVVQAFYNKYPDKVNTKIPLEEAFKNDLEIVKAQFRDMGFYVDSFPKPPARIWGEQKAENWDALQDYLVKTAQIKEKKNPAEYFTDEFSKAANDFDKAAFVKEAKEFKVSVQVK